MDEQSKHSITTEDLAIQLREINRRLDQGQQAEIIRQKARHDANSELAKTILKFGTETIATNDQINNLETIVKQAVNSLAPFAEIKDDAREIKRVLFGDDKKREKGLVQRFDEVDTVVKKALVEQRAFFIAIGVIGALVTFAKGSGILKWLSGP